MILIIFVIRQTLPTKMNVARDSCTKITAKLHASCSPLRIVTFFNRHMDQHFTPIVRHHILTMNTHAGIDLLSLMMMLDSKSVMIGKFC